MTLLGNELKHLKENSKQGILLFRNEKAWNTFNPITASHTFYLIDPGGTIKMNRTGGGKLKVVEKIPEDLL